MWGHGSLPVQGQCDRRHTLGHSRITGGLGMPLLACVSPVPQVWEWKAYLTAPVQAALISELLGWRARPRARGLDLARAEPFRCLKSSPASKAKACDQHWVRNQGNATKVVCSQ